MNLGENAAHEELCQIGMPMEISAFFYKRKFQSIVVTMGIETKGNLNWESCFTLQVFKTWGGGINQISLNNLQTSLDLYNKTTGECLFG